MAVKCMFYSHILNKKVLYTPTHTYIYIHYNVIYIGQWSTMREITVLCITLLDSEF